MKNKRKSKPSIAESIRFGAALMAASGNILITDFNFSDERIANQLLFEENFTMLNDAADIALEAALLGYNDNLN